MIIPLNVETENTYYKIFEITSVDYPLIGSIVLSVNKFFLILRILKLVIHC